MSHLPDDYLADDQDFGEGDLVMFRRNGVLFEEEGRVLEMRRGLISERDTKVIVYWFDRDEILAHRTHTLAKINYRRTGDEAKL